MDRKTAEEILACDENNGFTYIGRTTDIRSDRGVVLTDVLRVPTRNLIRNYDERVKQEYARREGIFAFLFSKRAKESTIISENLTAESRYMIPLKHPIDLPSRPRIC